VQRQDYGLRSGERLRLRRGAVLSAKLRLPPSQPINCLLTAGTGRIWITGNAGQSLEEAAKRVVEWAAVKLADLPHSRLGPGMALLTNVDCHFQFVEASLARQDSKFALPMAAALYCALTGATARVRTMLIGNAGREGLLVTMFGATKNDVDALECLRGHVNVLVMEEKAKDMFDSVNQQAWICCTQACSSDYSGGQDLHGGDRGGGGRPCSGAVTIGRSVAACSCSSSVAPPAGWAAGGPGC
jgi:hypothetical protein